LKKKKGRIWGTAHTQVIWGGKRGWGGSTEKGDGQLEEKNSAPPKRHRPSAAETIGQKRKKKGEGKENTLKYAKDRAGGKRYKKEERAALSCVKKSKSTSRRGPGKVLHLKMRVRGPLVLF